MLFDDHKTSVPTLSSGPAGIDGKAPAVLRYGEVGVV